MLFSVNAFTQYHALGTSEGLRLDKAATIDWKCPLADADKISLNPSHAQRFTSTVEEQAKTYGYSLLTKRVPNDKQVDPVTGNVTFLGHKDILKTWNEITIDIIQKNATETWGDKSWTVTDVKEIAEFTEARGELIPNGAAQGQLTAEGRKAFMRRQKSKYLAHHILGLLTPIAREAIMVEESKFEWFDEDSGETAYDGLTILFLVLT